MDFNEDWTFIMRIEKDKVNKSVVIVDSLIGAQIMPSNIHCLLQGNFWVSQGTLDCPKCFLIENKHRLSDQRPFLAKHFGDPLDT